MSWSSSSNLTSHQLCFLLCFTLFLAAAEVESRPSADRADAQILEELFGPQIRTLILADPEVTEGSNPAESDRAAPRHLVELVIQQRKFRGRSRKPPPRGCFGLKMDRIGVVSGLGC
ncbi:C-type natriuretic peptide 2-like [Denticeps clupeoides]|uniref:C-type natriuretic peptide n=1 Tax=Denticeps clupeoides TaxID=299321 RepID=A0AAY4BRK1_9TELE|nr:C-type natriuretic peptide 2-like [Denticeps clupeoides]